MTKAALSSSNLCGLPSPLRLPYSQTPPHPLLALVIPSSARNLLTTACPCLALLRRSSAPHLPTLTIPPAFSPPSFEGGGAPTGCVGGSPRPGAIALLSALTFPTLPNVLPRHLLLLPALPRGCRPFNRSNLSLLPGASARHPLSPLSLRGLPPLIRSYFSAFSVSPTRPHSAPLHRKRQGPKALPLSCPSFAYPFFYIIPNRKKAPMS